MIEISKLDLVLNGKKILEKFDCNFPKEKLTCLLGKSGVGKSALLRVIAGVLPKVSGMISTQRNAEKNIAYLGQDDGLLPWLSALENVLIGAKLRGENWRSKVYKSRAFALLGQVGLSEVCDFLPEQLSGGMRQRVALARTLFEDREFILMDEPFSALDTVTRFALQKITVEAFSGRTVFMVTHDPREALHMADFIAVMSGTPPQIRKTLWNPKSGDAQLWKLHNELMMALQNDDE